MTDPDLTEAQRAQLAALADGRLGAAERAAIEADPRLAALAAEQRAVVQVIQAAGETVGAPARLRAAVAQAGRRPEARRARLRLTLALAGAGAAAALVLAVALPSGTPGAPGVVEAATLGQRPATLAAPAQDPARPALLAEAQSGVAFPQWAKKFGWRAVGARRDDLSGRHTTTVFYENEAGKRIAYTIVSGKRLADPAGARATTSNGVAMLVLGRGARTIVAWTRGGHQCVLSGAGVKTAKLLELASWKGKGTVAF